MTTRSGKLKLCISGNKHAFVKYLYQSLSSMFYYIRAIPNDRSLYWPIWMSKASTKVSPSCLFWSNKMYPGFNLNTKANDAVGFYVCLPLSFVAFYLQYKWLGLNTKDIESGFIIYNPQPFCVMLVCGLPWDILLHCCLQLSCVFNTLPHYIL